MKNKLLIWGSLLAAVIMIVSGCGVTDDVSGIAGSAQEQTVKETIQIASAVTSEPEAEKAEVDYTHVYGVLLDGYYNLILNNSENHDFGEGETGVLEAISGRESGDALFSVGYAIKDISGDGIPELLICAIAEHENSISYGSKIYAAYTLIDDMPRFSFEGIARSGYRYLGEGKFFYQGSNGAMYTIFGIYTISSDGMSLSCNDFYFTYEKDDQFEEIGFYHNTSGEWDKSVSEKLLISADQFWQIESDLEKQIHNIALIPFSAYKLSSGEKDAVGLQVHAQWAEDVLHGFSVYDGFVADTTEPQARVVFTTDRIVENFKVLALTLEDVDDNGKMIFSTKELYTLDTLVPDRPLVVSMTFYGTIPYYGVSYVDGKGKTRNFAVEVSGEDGSLSLTEF